MNLASGTHCAVENRNVAEVPAVRVIITGAPECLTEGHDSSKIPQLYLPHAPRAITYTLLAVVTSL